MKNVQRPYENMISVLHKFPWSSPELITIDERQALWKTAMALLSQLMYNISNGHHPIQLTTQLLQQFACAMLTVPFSPQQKQAMIAVMHPRRFGSLLPADLPFLNINLMGDFWPFRVVDRKDAIDFQVLNVSLSLHMMHNFELTVSTVLRLPGTHGRSRSHHRIARPTLHPRLNQHRRSIRCSAS